MKINAMQIDCYKSIRRWDEAFEAGEKTTPQIIKLAEILDQLEPQGDDNLHTIWAKAHRPTFRQFYNQNYSDEKPYKEASARILDDAKKYYVSSYPVPDAWYQISVKHFERGPGDEFYAFFVDNSFIFSVNENYNKTTYEGVDLLDWAISAAKSFVNEVQSGTVKENVLDKIPYIYREGRIRRGDLWKACPRTKKQFFKPYNKNEIKKFYSYYKSGKSGNAYLSEMTARTIYEACKVIYESLGICRETADFRYTENDAEREHYGGASQTPKEMYYSIADGRDNGLKDVPMDDPLAFEEWKSHQGPYYKFNGSHPWEIIPSFSTLFSLYLIPRKDDTEGYYFDLSGESIARAPETIIAANALYEAGYPIRISGMDVITDRIDGNDYISVVPIGEPTIFRNCIKLPNGDAGIAVAEKTIWEFDEYRLKEET